MGHEKKALRIGDRYRWGDKYERNSTTLAGFFLDAKKDRNLVALTIRPPYGYEIEYSDRIEIVGGLICLLSINRELVDRTEDQALAFDGIHNTEMAFRSACEIIVSRGDRVQARVIGINRAVIDPALTNLNQAA
jgi:hypothetical protein